MEVAAKAGLTVYIYIYIYILKLYCIHNRNLYSSVLKCQRTMI